MSEELLFPSAAPVTLGSRFEEILGNKASEMSEKERRVRWATWIKLARKSGKKDAVKWWVDSGECRNCIHLRGRWCSLMELPCTVNPILTFHKGLVGFACMGAGYETKKEVAA